MDLDVHKMPTPAGTYVIWAAAFVLMGAIAWHFPGVGLLLGIVMAFSLFLFRITRDTVPRTRLLRTEPIRFPPTQFPRATKGSQTVVATVQMVSKPLRCPCPVEGDVVAWSLDRLEQEGVFYTVSCRTTLHLESPEGGRFVVELTNDWRPITASQTRLPRPSNDDETAAARRAWAEALEDIGGPGAVTDEPGFEAFPEDFAYYSGCDVMQSVILAGREVAISGEFEAMPAGYPRGDSTPLFRLRSGTVDDFTLDAAWRRSALLHRYVIPVIAFIFAAALACGVFLVG